MPAPAAPTPALQADPPPVPPMTMTGDTLTLPFGPQDATLAAESRQRLDALADRMVSTPALNAQILAYAGSTDGGPSQARRLSLTRALAVRGALLDHGIASTRIEVRALGDQAPDGPADRVDIRLLTP